MKRTVQVTVMGRQYTIRSEASPDEVERVAAFANEQISGAAASGATVDTLGSTVLALLNVSGALLRLQQEKGREAEAVEHVVRLTERLGRALDPASEGRPAEEKRSLYGDFR